MNQSNRPSAAGEFSVAAQSESTERNKCVADVMTRKTVTLSPHHSFAEAVSLMTDRHFRHIVVIDTGGHIVGVISDRDILRTLARTTNWQTKDVSQIMTREPFTVTKRINCLPVLDDEGKVCGIVTSTDLLKAYQKLLESLEGSCAKP